MRKHSDVNPLFLLQKSWRFIMVQVCICRLKIESRIVVIICDYDYYYDDGFYGDDRQ